MFGQNQVSDRELLRTVNSRLTRTGTGSRVTASINRGTVTLSGNLQYAAQRIPIVNAASRVAGVKQVIDQMQFAVKKSFMPPTKAPPKQNALIQPIAPSAVAPPEENPLGIADPENQPSELPGTTDVPTAANKTPL